MNQLQDKRRVVYVDDYDRDHYDMAPRQDYDVVYVRRPRARRRQFRPDAFVVGTFWFGVLAFVLLAFVVDSPEWLLQRGALALIFLMFGAFVFAFLYSMWQGIRDTFFWWRHDDE